MRNITKKQWYIGTLLSFLLLFFTFGWIEVYRLIATPQDGGGWLSPIIWFSLGVSSLGLLAFSSADRRVFSLGTVLSLLPSVFFVREGYFLFMVLLSVFLGVAALSRMRYASELHVKVHVRRSMQHGVGVLALVFSLVVTLFYYAQIRTASSEELLTRLALDRASHSMLTQSLGLINPEFKKVNQENVTVDEFLLTFQENSVTEDPFAIPSDGELLGMAGLKPNDPRAPRVLARMKQEMKQGAGSIDSRRLMLEQGRRQLSEIAGHPLSGQEHIADVLSEVVDQRVRTYFQPNMMSGHEAILPFILSLILFLTLWSLGAFLAVVWCFATAGAFVLLRRSGVIEIRKVAVDQEVIA